VSASVGILHYSCPPIVGGVESVLATHARMCLDHGFRVVVIAGRGARFDPRLELRRLPSIDSRFRELEEINAELRQGVVSDRFRRLSKEIERDLAEALGDLDYCIVHNAFSLHFNLPLTVALHALARRRACRFIAWCHDLSWTNPLYIPLMREAEPWTLLKTPADDVHYVTVSEFRADELAEIFGDHARVQSIPNGIDARRFLGLSSATATLLKDLRVLDRDPFLLLPARITRRKNIELAVRVVGELVKLGKSPLLLVTGPPGPHNPRSIDYVDELNALIAELELHEQVVLLHQRARSPGRHWEASDAMVRELYRVADALIFPSAQEGFGIPVLEAGIARSPIFCSDIPPFRDIADGLATFFNLDDQPMHIARQIVAELDSQPTSLLHRRTLQGYDWSAIFERQILPLLSGASVASMGAHEVSARG
jgi:glycosyltransferase involved in cell wall biosynthesis